MFIIILISLLISGNLYSIVPTFTDGKPYWFVVERGEDYTITSWITYP
jgi:hypothetical protein